MSRRSSFSLRGRKALIAIKDERDATIVRRQFERLGIDGSNNHCVLTPRLAVSNAGGQFDIFWEADAPVKPDPYLTQLDVAVSPARDTSKGSSSPNAPHLRVVK